MIAIESTPVVLDELREKIRAIQKRERPMLDAFHELFYFGHTWSFTRWMGVPALKSPCDLFALADIITSIKPALIVETGTAYGGSALFMAHVCDGVGSGSIITIDIEPHHDLPRHPRITYRLGASLSPEIVAYVRDRAARCDGPVLVILDADHHEASVAAELATYAPLVTPDSFVIVEDTNVNGHPILPEHGPGPWEAVQVFLAAHPEFVADPLPERYLVSMHPGGWLRRIA